MVTESFGDLDEYCKKNPGIKLNICLGDVYRESKWDDSDEEIMNKMQETGILNSTKIFKGAKYVSYELVEE